ncbi:MAG: hypothetical protein M1826_007261 [Phylliscum demangeonii]|nr:MAG: hypothetical protein M1826_007261 [Phylliscum demangeonii]
MVAGVHVAATSSYRIIVLTLSQRCNEREIRVSSSSSSSPQHPIQPAPLFSLTICLPPQTRPFTGYRTQADWLNSIVNECLDRYDVLHLAAPRPATPSTHPQLDHAVVPEDLHSGEGGGEGEGEGGVSKFVEPTAAALRKAFRPWPLAARRAWVRAARAASPAHDLEASLASSLAAAADRY